jgi:alanine dehydrogenase
MIVGVPKETRHDEHRVGLTPFAVSRLVKHGHQVYLEHDAGEDSHFHDEAYAAAGAQIVFDTDEVYQRADLVCRVGALDADEVDLVRPGSTVCGFLHLAMAPREQVARLAERKVTLFGYEIIEDHEGHRPVLISLSEIAGHMAVHTAAHLLEHDSGGRGIVLGGTPGMAPATVVVLGAGTAGRTVAALAHACGAHVIVLDAHVSRLREAVREVSGDIVTSIASHRNLGRYTAIADVLIGAVLIPGGRAPFLVTEEMVKGMKRGSVILDLSIDQGGCVETSRPTQLHSPTFQMHGVTHYAVPNMTANVPRSASRALSIAAEPYLVRLATEGVESALRADAGLGRGAYLYKGHVVNELAAHALGVEHVPLSGILG